ncbi:IclR family transcriptional regulator [Nonomuraea sp. B19D2]|uniref:IclR family transcriptional regulator n=1 Tax=Nonomuraea sp. B19D2 TaxID=3159561 RepID=UPI0032DB856E
MVKSAERALEIIEVLTQRHRGMTFAEICTVLDLPKSSAHGLLGTMVGRGFVAFDETARRYSLGVRVWEAGQAYLATVDLERAALPIMEGIRDELNEIVQLAILDGIDNLYVAKVDPDQALMLASRVGARIPAHTTALGKALLAGLDDAEVRRRFEGVAFTRFTDHTIGSIEELVTELTSVRRLGYATDRGEYTPGIFCVGVPVRDHTGRVRAGMSVSVPEVRLSPALRRRMLDTLVRNCAELSSRLGYRPGAA